MDQNNELFVVGIGASVGGLEAISQLFDNLSDSTGMVFIICQHLSPDYKSLMPELLGRHTKMKIYTAEHGQSIQPNCIYLNQSGKNLQIENQKFLLTDFSQNTSFHLPIDVFFESIGNEFAEKSMCMVMSGTGSDGSRGLKTVKELGGTVIAQEPNSAQFDAMPNAAIATNMVDFVLDPIKMAELLPKLRNTNFDFNKADNQLEESESNDDLFLKILNEIHKSTGIDFKDYKKNTLIRRLEKRMNIKGYESLKEYYLFLRNTPDERDILMHDFLIGVTSFFRDIEAFTVLNEKVIPEICQSKGENELIRIWIPGCSTGEEVFSIAILFAEYITRNNLNLDFKIFATDVDSNAISRASTGTFHLNIINEIEKEYLDKYFINTGNQMVVCKQIREKIVFSAHNILKDPPFIRMDFISCRNLFIYLDSHIQKKVLLNFQFALNKFGYLFMGNSESIGEIRKFFNPIDSKWKIFQNVSDKKPLTSQYSIINKVSINSVHSTKKIEMTEYKAKENPESIFHRYLSNKYSPSCIFIDKNFNILFLKGDAGKKLIHSEGLFERNLLKVVDSELASFIRDGINRLDSEKKEVVYLDIINEVDNKQYKYNLSFYHPDNSELQDAYVIEFSEEKQVNDSDKIILENIKVDDYSKQRIAYLEDELTSVKNELQNAIEELETSNEELQSSNEELMSSNEELQGTNEELQSSNEELYTVNTEFLEKNKELIDLNNDINNLLNSTDIGTLFLDNDLKIRKFTPALQKHFKLQESDIGRPITSFASNFNVTVRESILKDSQRVLKELVIAESEITDNASNIYLKRISPFITNEKKIDGVVIAFIDITQLKKAELQIISANQRLELANIVSENAIWEMDYNANRMITTNKIWDDLYGIENDDITSKWDNNIHKDDVERVWKSVKNHFEGKTEKYFHEYRYRNPNTGLEYWISNVGKVVKYNEDGSPAIVLGVSVDITEKKRIEVGLRESEYKFRKMFESSPFGMVMVNEQFKFIASNSTFCEILGYTEEEILKLTFSDITFKDDIEKDVDAVTNLIQGERSIYKTEKRYIRKTGELIWTSLTVYANFSEDGKFKYNLATIEDISYRKQAEIEIKRITERLDLATSSSNIGIWDWDLLSNKLIWDSQMCKLYGIEDTNDVDHFESWLTRVHPDDVEKTNNAVEMALKGNQDYETDYRVVWSDNSIRWIKAFGKVFTDSDNNPIRMVGINFDITKQKRSEIELIDAYRKIEESEQNFKIIATSTPDHIIVQDKDLVYTMVVNPQMGLIADEMIGKTDFDLLQYDDAVKLKEQKTNVLQTGELARIETSLRNNSGELEYFTGSYVPKYNENNQIDGLVGYFTNVTAKVKIEQELIKAKNIAETNEQKYKSLFTSMQEGVYLHELVYDNDGKAINYRIIDANPISEKYLNIKRDNAIGKLATELFKTPEAPFLDIYSQVAETGLPQTFTQFYEPMDKHFFISVFSPQKGQFATAFFDITESKEFEQALLSAKAKAEESEARFKAISEKSVDGITLANTKGNYVFVNPAYCNLLGYSETELLAMNIKDVLHREEKLIAFPETIQKGFANRQNVKLKHKNGSIVFTDIYGKLFEFNKEKLVLGIVHDISERHKFEVELIEAKDKAEESDRFKTAFLQNISHEIRTPLNAIMGFSDLLASNFDDRAKLESFTSIIVRRSSDLLDIINDIIDISKIESGQLPLNIGTCNLHELFTELTSIANSLLVDYDKSQINLELCVENNVANTALNVDNGKLKQIIINLLSNAIKYTEQGSIKYGYKIENEQIVFFVFDTGIGFSSDSYNLIFERFARLSNSLKANIGGTGLGLSIVKGLVDLMDGEIWVESEPNKGSKFYFTISYTLSNTVQNHIAPNFHGAKLVQLNRTVLIVEDDSWNARYIKEVLSSIISNILIATTGQEAIDLIKENDIDLILLDIRLPDMSGYEVITELKKLDVPLNIIVQTAYASSDERLKAFEHGCVDYISKPIKESILVESVYSQLIK